MKKIGIITIHRINNYGALLQAYALNKYLSNKGFDVKTIDFRTQRVAESYKIFQKSYECQVKMLDTYIFYCYNSKG